MKPDDLLFAKTHEWVYVDKSAKPATATIGISQFALEALTDLVHIELPKLGRKLKAGETFGEVESVKAVSDLYSPIAGEVVESQTKLADDLAVLSDDPFGKGWLLKARITDNSSLNNLLDRAAYEKHCESEAH